MLNTQELSVRLGGRPLSPCASSWRRSRRKGLDIERDGRWYRLRVADADALAEDNRSRDTRATLQARYDEQRVVFWRRPALLPADHPECVLEVDLDGRPGFVSVKGELRWQAPPHACPSSG